MRYFTVLSTLVLFLFGCGDNENKSTTPKKPEEKPQVFEIEKGGEVDPIASSDAKKGGTYVSWGSSFPKSLNYYLDPNSLSNEVTGLMFEGLVTLHSTKNEPVGNLAQSWSVSDDGMEFSFKIHPKAKWSDGKDITANDIQFYYDVIMNPKNLTSVFRVGLKRFERPEVVSPKQIKIRAKSIHWKNFWEAAGLMAFPKHVWEGKDFNKINFDFPVVSGPYEVGETKKGRSLKLKRRKNWWGQVKKYNQYKYNFDTIQYRFIEDRVKALELFKKGDLDAYAIYTSKIWMKQTHFDSVKNGWVVRQKIYNKEPLGYQGLAINMRRPLYQDIRVRKALCYLLDRKVLNDKYMYNQYFLLNSYYPDLYLNNKNPNAELFEYNPEKARSLLKEAGWLVGDDGILTKEGNKLKVNFLTYSSDQRHLNFYCESLKSVGIQTNINLLSASSVKKRLDQHDFDMFWSAWGASRLRDPESSWHSSTADQKASFNYPGFKSKKVDELIEKQKTEMSLDKRNQILKEIDLELTKEIPYVLLWQSGFHRMLYWNKFGTPKTVFDKFNREDSAVAYWWVDENKKVLLEKAKKNNESLPKLSESVHYSE